MGFYSRKGGEGRGGRKGKRREGMNEVGLELGMGVGREEEVEIFGSGTWGVCLYVCMYVLYVCGNGHYIYIYIYVSCPYL